MKVTKKTLRTVFGSKTDDRRYWQITEAGELLISDGYWVINLAHAMADLPPEFAGYCPAYCGASAQESGELSGGYQIRSDKTLSRNQGAPDIHKYLDRPDEGYNPIAQTPLTYCLENSGHKLVTLFLDNKGVLWAIDAQYVAMFDGLFSSYEFLASSDPDRHLLVNADSPSDAGCIVGAVMPMRSSVSNGPSGLEKLLSKITGSTI